MDNNVEYEKEIHIKMTSDDMEKIRGRMAEVGSINMSAYMRKMALNGYIIVLDLSDVKEVLRLLHIAGNNLNQYARKANVDGGVYNIDMRNLKESFEEINETMKAILIKLSSIY